jgi:hypothetical protein
MQQKTRITALTVLEGRVERTLPEKVSAFMGTTLGTALGLGLFLALYALVGTMEFNALSGL